MNRVKEGFCPHSNLKLIKKEENYKVKGDIITIEAQVPYCMDCEQEVFIPQYDDVNLKKAYAVYRKNHDLLSQEEIIGIRKKYNLTQRTFAILIGCTQNTIVRYESGAIPDLPYNRIIKLMENPNNVLTLLEDAREKMDIRECERLEKHLNQLVLEKNEKRDLFLLFNSLENKPVDSYSGFKKFNVNKVVAMIMFFASNQQVLFKTKLMKLLWYTDFFSFKQYIKSISGMRYVHQYYGPIPEDHDLILGVLKSGKYINIVENEFGEVIETYYEPDLSCFSSEELEILKIVDAKFKNVSAAQISKISHNEKAYIETEMKEFISYDYAKDIAAI